MKLDWLNANKALEGFGGKPITLHVTKTGLPFFDTLRLYGAIELYIGLREETTISDEGFRWIVKSKSRQNSQIKAKSALLSLRKGKSQKGDDSVLIEIEKSILNGEAYLQNKTIDNTEPLRNPDSILKDGIRGIAASKYNGLESGYGYGSKISLYNAILSLAGQKRIHSNSNIYFLPVFEGRVDFSKIISPIRNQINHPNAFLVQVYELLNLKTSLFFEGYEERLSAVAYNTNYGGQSGNYNYSGLISIASTALKKRGISKETTINLFNTYKFLLPKSYANNKTTAFFQPTLNLANWIVHPLPKYLSSMITSQEILKRDFGSNEILFQNSQTIKDVFMMTYGNKWDGDHEAIQKLAKAVSSSIYFARQIESDKSKKSKSKEDYEKERKRWYDEVVMLRSAPNLRAFRERVLILIEQGKKERQEIGTHINGEDFEPKIFESIGDNRHSFEIFRDLFRMYLIQESIYKTQDNSTGNNQTTNTQQNG